MNPLTYAVDWFSRALDTFCENHPLLAIALTELLIVVMILIQAFK